MPCGSCNNSERGSEPRHHRHRRHRRHGHHGDHEHHGQHHGCHDQHGHHDHHNDCFPKFREPCHEHHRVHSGADQEADVSQSELEYDLVYRVHKGAASSHGHGHVEGGFGGGFGGFGGVAGWGGCGSCAPQWNSWSWGQPFSPQLQNCCGRQLLQNYCNEHGYKMKSGMYYGNGGCYDQNLVWMPGYGGGYGNGVAYARGPYGAVAKGPQGRVAYMGYPNGY